MKIIKNDEVINYYLTQLNLLADDLKDEKFTGLEHNIIKENALLIDYYLNYYYILECLILFCDDDLKHQIKENSINVLKYKLDFILDEIREYVNIKIFDYENYKFEFQLKKKYKYEYDYNK